MNESEFFKIIGYIMASQYRQDIIKSIGTSMKTPSNIGKEIDLRTNHVSNVLKELKEKELVVCLNEDAAKADYTKILNWGLKSLNIFKKNKNQYSAKSFEYLFPETDLRFLCQAVFRKHHIN